ncbi:MULTISPECIES: IS21 family transposase [Burkholderiaceae]|uniref:IS21 family transposase n=1 Tax=Burkholderiaceae TaxID=119060 RepID=UPI000965FAEC|nr:IS21 family transposase [Burkholderia sp. b14]SIT65487.1 Transposase [Burkholderia sp. b14]
MPTPRITMRQIRNVLRLHLEAGLTYGQIGRALGVPKSTVGKIVVLARVAGIDWAEVQGLDDASLEARLYQPAVPRSARHLEPDFAYLHQELKRPGVTLQLFWEEYARANAQAYKYTSFCVKYRKWAACLKRSMRQTHIAGDKLFADYAGQSVPIIDAVTGQIRAAQVFVALLGASNYTYACATERQTAADWIRSLIAALEFFGGTPRLIVPDQPRALIAQPDRYEPGMGRLVEEFCDHYHVAVLPARPAHPRDKPKVENAVLVVERWILARLRNRRFFSLAELNTAIAELLHELNCRPFKKLPGNRREAFERLDQPALQPLASNRMAIVRFKRARVNVDYHVELDGHYYSVPHRLVRSTVQLRIGATAVEVFDGATRVAIHLLSAARGGFTTDPDHMPASHRAHREWTPTKLMAWGKSIGSSCAAVVHWQMENRPHPEQGYRACLGLQHLGRRFGAQRLEAACTRAMAINSPTYRTVKSILDNGMDRQPLPGKPIQTSVPLHENVRGPEYYH